jgi:hypothetical protein
MSDQVKEKALRYNDGKLQWGLVHFKSLEPMIQVLEFGAKKYAPDNWKKQMDRKKLLESAMRHMAALMDGQENDPETGLSHIGHLMCNALFYSYHFAIKKDDLVSSDSNTGIARFDDGSEIIVALR